MHRCSFYLGKIYVASKIQALSCVKIFALLCEFVLIDSSKTNLYAVLGSIGRLLSGIQFCMISTFYLVLFSFLVIFKTIAVPLWRVKLHLKPA